MPASQTASADSDLLEELTVVDTEVHTAETADVLMEYIEDDKQRELQQAGYPIGPESWGPIPWDGWDRSAGGRIDWDNFVVPSAEEYDEKRREFGIDKVVFSPGAGFKIFQIPNERTRATFMRAMNNFTVDKYALGDGTYYGKILGVPELPEETAAEIERYGDHDGIVAVFMTALGPEYPLGHQMYHPIYEAAEKYDLPIVLHGESSMYPSFPTGGLNMANFVEVHTLCHPFLQAWHAVSVIAQGIPERFDIDWGFWEAGQSWIQMIKNRMDREYVERPNDLPDLTKLPSEYMSDFYYATQPLEEPAKPEHLGQILSMNDIEDQLCLSTDWPHMDFDSPASVVDHEGLSREQKTKILQDNGLEFFDLD